MTRLAILAVALAATATSAHAVGFPTKNGQCKATKITAIRGRITDKPDANSGSMIEFADGERAAFPSLPSGAARKARVGDAVTDCQVSWDKRCVPDDYRSRTVKITLKRTGGAFTTDDDDHMCEFKPGFSH